MMSLIDIFPKLCQVFPKAISVIIRFGFVIIYYYHLVTSSVFLNVAFEKGSATEHLANTILIPVHYLLGGNLASSEGNHYVLSHRFHYRTKKWCYAPLSFYFFTPSITLGSFCKSLAFISPNVRQRHTDLKNQLLSTQTHSHLERYKSMGLKIENFAQAKRLSSLKRPRREEDCHHLALEKKALAAISRLLHHHDIPFWVDCGTLLGTYLYEGVIPWDHDIDIGILAPDFTNTFRALRELDPKLYCIQDWSSRTVPGSYLRVYLKENQSYIDIFHYRIDPKEKNLTFILSYKESAFMAKEWKIREKHHVQPIPFAAVFPLKKGNFDGLFVPVPRDTPYYLRSFYGNILKPVKVYNATTCCYEKDPSHPYWKIPLVK